MNLYSTLSYTFILLITNSSIAFSAEPESCQQALQKGDVAQALSTAKSTLAVNAKDADTLLCQGRAFTASQDFNSALDAFKLAQLNASDSTQKTIAALLIGNAQLSLKQPDLAIASFLQALEHAKTTNSATYVRASHLALGNAYLNQQQFEPALAQYQAVNKLDANDNERGESFEKIALTHHKMGQHDAALEFQIKAYMMHEKSGTLDQYAHSSIELGRYYGQAKQYIRAENTLNKIIKFAKEQGGAYYEAKGSCVLGIVKAAEGEKEAAKALVEYAKSIAKNTQDKSLEEEINQETQGLL